MPPLDDREDSDSDYKSDELVAAPATTLANDEVQTRFDEIIANAIKGNLPLGKKEKRKEFLKIYGHVLGKTTKANDQTLLHIVANNVGHKSPTRFLIRNNKKLLEHKDQSGKISLHIGIIRNSSFLEVVLEEIKDLNILLRMTCEYSRNCIHMAIYHGLEQKYTIKLIEKATEATLCATDQGGLTPLHLAVEYERSSKSHLSIVKALIAYGDSALNKFTNSPKNLSVYEYLHYRRSQVVKRSARGTERSQEEPRRGMQDQKSNPTEGRGIPEGSSENGNDKGTRVPQEPRVEEVQGKVPTVPLVSGGRRGLAFISLTVTIKEMTL
ncbi:MAG: hypothetical protein M1834_009345 [Cirrosporium novae-zelandiae]|nr:MAG: hypothetical protein M1834_009345 [Cirrosporium novae-zelandiae]